MHIWTIDKWKKTLENKDIRHGLRVRYEKDVNEEVKLVCKEFFRYLRSEYYFPIRVAVYIKSTERIKALDGDLVCGTCFMPSDPLVEPYIRIATGDYELLVSEGGKDYAAKEILYTIAHELTHYFQWVNSLQLTEMGEERQAKQYGKFIIDDYEKHLNATFIGWWEEQGKMSYGQDILDSKMAKDFYQSWVDLGKPPRWSK